MNHGTEPKALSVSNLVKRFDALTAVDQISFDIAKGECFALLGPNGAGKTTLCEMLEGLLPPDSGEISILGYQYDKNRERILQKTGVLLQESNLYKRFTVRETLQLFASFYKTPKDSVVIAENLGLTEKLNTQLRHLSGGQKQRVYLGCALINDPEILFLDEPTTGLDPQTRQSLWHLIQGLKKENKAILLTTHYMEEAERLADRVAIIDRGHFIAMGTPQELIKQHCHDEFLTLELHLGDDSLLKIKELLSKKLPWFTQAEMEGAETLTVAAPNLSHHMPEVIRVADELGIVVKSIQLRHGSLEDVFIRLTGRSIREG